jgi:signal transduction histidine kinase
MAGSTRLKSWIYVGAGIALAVALVLPWPQAWSVLLATNGYAPHGYCIGWEPNLLWLHVTTDVMIGLSYVVIALFLAVLVHFVRHDIPFHWILLAFGTFIITCGSTHFMEAWTFWFPLYWLSGGTKVVTAIASVATAAALPPLLPRILNVVAAAKVSNARKQQLERANAELALLYERVKELDDVKTQFFANVSHELRTPLTLILGPTRAMLAQPALTPEQRRSLEVVTRNAETLLGYVDDLLDIAQIEATQLHLHPTAVDLVALVRRCAAHFDALAQERRIDLVIEAPDAVPAVVDAEQIQRVVLNLLGNAFKFTPDGGTVRCAVESSGAYATITAADSGPGIPPEQRAVVFERFRQAATDGRRGQGIGLGLAIVKAFVERHGGQVAVDDAPEGGARFTVTLPVGTASSATVVPIAALASPPAGETRLIVSDGPPTMQGEEAATTTGAGPRVLIVEDNPDMRAFLVETLADYQVTTAADGADGLAQAHRDRPDLIISDVMMPILTGDRLVQAVRTAPALADIPVVMLTARADAALRVQLLRDGAQDYLVKPFAPEELRARVHNLVQIKRTRDVLQSMLDSRERDLAALAGDVAQRTAEREAALARERETAARNADLYAETRAALGVRDEFIRIASHELKTPITALLGHTQLLARRLTRSGALSGRDQRAIQIITGQAARLHLLVEQLLDLTHIDHGELILTRRPLDLAALVQHVVDETQPALDRHQLVVEVNALTTMVTGDTVRLAQVLHNLLSNAVKYSPGGGPVIVRVIEHDAELGVTVIDRGIGIPAAALPHLFTRFYRAPNVASEQFSGMGIGLYVVRANAEAHGGRVTVESVEGEGSTITLWLPKSMEPRERG